MLREVFIAVYLAIFQGIFNICKIFPLQRKTTFVASFGGNILFTAQKMQAMTDHQIVILKTAQCPITFPQSSKIKNYTFEFKHLFQWILSIYHLATSRHIIVDNYYGFLAVTNFKKETTCIQLWHAAGAIKQFGLRDLAISHRPARAFSRFKRVYQRFDHVVVGSNRMATIFRESFSLSKKQILKTGVPRTDFFFNVQLMTQAKQTLQKDFPVIQQKKVILYAPTYRDHELESPQLNLNLQKMYNALKYDYVLFLRLHPAVNGTFENKFPGFVYNVSNYPDVNQLLVITDLLITDYSSIPFEFSLLEKPMIFYAYDLKEYEKTKGFWEDYTTLVPGPVAKTTDEVICYIKNQSYDLERIRSFAKEWNEYSMGRSSEALVKKLIDRERIKDDLRC